MTAGALFDPDPGGRPRRELVPGAVHVPSWLTSGQQQWIAGRFFEWARGPVPVRAAKVRGHEMSVRTVCLGWHWQPYQYTREATDVNGRRVLPFPGWMVGLGRLALAAAAGDPRAGDGYTPDAALVNYYDRGARLGMHQDKDEHADAPVVSLSVGDSCTFRFGNTRDRGRPYQDVLLASGDLFVFGGPVRFAFHGVTKVHPGTARCRCQQRAACRNQIRDPPAQRPLPDPVGHWRNPCWTQPQACSTTSLPPTPMPSKVVPMTGARSAPAWTATASP